MSFTPTSRNHGDERIKATTKEKARCCRTCHFHLFCCFCCLSFSWVACLFVFVSIIRFFLHPWLPDWPVCKQPMGHFFKRQNYTQFSLCTFVHVCVKRQRQEGRREGGMTRSSRKSTLDSKTNERRIELCSHPPSLFFSWFDKQSSRVRSVNTLFRSWRRVNVALCLLPRVQRIGESSNPWCDKLTFWSEDKMIARK